MLLLSACGGGSGDDSPTATGGDASATTAQSGGSSTPGSGLEDQTFPVGQHFWHSGFRVEVLEGEILSVENQLSGRVSTSLTLSVSLENLGDDTGFFGPPVAVVTSSNSYPSNFSSDLPDVPGGLESQAKLVFPIDDDFDLTGALLVVGEADENRAQVPLQGNGEAIRLEPSQPAVSGSLSMELVDLIFTSADVRYDLPDRHREVEKGKVALTLRFDAVSRKQGNWQIFAADLALTLPDGTSIAPDAIEIGSLPGSEAGTASPDRYARFLVDEGWTGPYTLRLTPGGWFVGDDGVSEATFDFTLG